MSTPRRNLSKKDFAYLLIALAAIAGSLLVIFTFLAIEEMGETLALILFLTVTGLLIAGYAVGLMVLGLVAIVGFSRLGNQSSKQHSAGKPA